MQKFGYAGLAAHRREHQAFVAKVGEFAQGFEEGRLGLSIQVMKLPQPVGGDSHPGVGLRATPTASMSTASP